MPTDLRALGVALAAIGAFLELYATQPLLPLLVREFAATPAAVSRTVSAPTFAVAIVAPFTGVAADLIGRKRVIVAALAALVVPTALAGAAPTLGAVVFWRFVQGLLLPPVFAVTIAYVGEEFGAQATAMTGVYVAATAVGGFLGRLLAALLAERLGWRAAFFGLALATAGCAAACALTLPRERHFRASRTLVAGLRMMAAHLGNGRLLATYAVGSGVLFSFVAVFTYVNFVLAAPPFSLSTAALGAVFVVYLAGIAVSPFAGRLVRLLGRPRLVIAAGIVWVAGLAVTLAPSLAAIVAGLAIAVSAGFLCQSLATSYVAVTAREARSSAVGLYVTFYYLGGGAGAVVPGYLWPLAQWPGTILLVVLVVAAITTLAAWLWRDADQRPPETPSAAPER